MSKTITVTTKITFVDYESLTVEDVTKCIAKTDAIYLQVIDKTVKADVKLIEITEDS